MGSSTGALIARLGCGWLGQKVNWHIGFAAAGIGMVLGVVQYVLGSKHLGDAGLHPAPAESPEAGARLRNRALTVGLVFLAVVAVLGIGAYTGSIPVTAKQIADAGAGVLLAIVVVLFGWLRRA